MKKKKRSGFTLVELLAVIVILAIILVIAVPQIIKTIDSARNGAFSSSAKLIATTAEKEYLARKTIGDTSFEGLDTIPCTDVVKENTNDYQSCDISFDENGKATVTLIGKGKFAGKYICNGNKTSAEVTEESCTLVALTVDANGGTNTVEYNAKYEASSTVPLTIPTAPEGKEFDYWQVSGTGASVIDNILTMGTSATTVKAIWKDVVVAVQTGVEKITALANDTEDAASNGLINANGIRYAGANSAVKNYIWFNCKDSYVSGTDTVNYGDEGYAYNETNCELWRIVGVFDGRIKIVRDEVLSTSMLWDISKWDGSEIEVYLNDGESSFYNSLSNEAKTQIGSKATWYTGAVAQESTPAQAYLDERTDTTGIENYVGLIYPSDYGYAGTNCTGEVTFHSEVCGSSNNWLKPSTGEYWTISQSTFKAKVPTHSGYVGWLVYSNGVVSAVTPLTLPYGVRPSVYLSPEVEIIDGDGTSGTATNNGVGPYIIKKMSS